MSFMNLFKYFIYIWIPWRFLLSICSKKCQLPALLIMGIRFLVCFSAFSHSRKEEKFDLFHWTKEVMT